MATATATKTDETIGVLSSGSQGELRVTLSAFKGRDYVSVRWWYTADDGTAKPGKKGITIDTELLPDLQAALAEVKARLDGGDGSGGD